MSFLSINKEMEEEGTALQKAGQIPVRSLVLVHPDTRRNQSTQRRGGYNHIRSCTLDLILCQYNCSKLLLP